jgi:ABC-type nitrate/sulfonate/bicarbonate transport system ATPase subunit
VSELPANAAEAASVTVSAALRPAGAASVTVRDLWAGYGGRRSPAAVLAGLDFSLAQGERLAVVGQSGCGKSTLLHVLAGLLPALSGEALVDGRPIAAADFEASGRPGCRSGHAAYMFQRDLLLPWKDVLGNAVFAAGVAPDGRRHGRPRRGRDEGAAGLEARARIILGEFGLGDELAAMPAQLSGGMRQRVALARTLVLGRGLVLLDEPLGSLDALTRAEMQSWLLDVMAAHPATWVLVTHDVREAVLLGDRVAVLAGRPARLEGWLQVPLSAGERRCLAGLEAGDLPAFACGATVDWGAAAVEADVGLDAAADTMRRLVAQVHGLLRERRAG